MNLEVAMKRKNIVLTLMAGFCLSGTVGLSETHADNPFEKLIPRGKLLKMLKDEISGEDNKIKLPDPRRGIQPRSNAPTPAERTGYSPRTTQQRESNRAISGTPSPTRTRPLPPLAAASREGMASSGKAAASRNSGFGMMVQKLPNGQLVVTGIQQSGNAAKAGIRTGDQVLSLGGGKLSEMEELKQIANTLGQGDQIEIELLRQGKKQKSVLQFGTAPQEGAIARTGRRNAGSVASANFDKSMLSVLDSPVEHISRLEPIVSSPAAPIASSGKITSLNQTIEQQQSEMQAMAEELKLLRKSHQPAVEPTENSWSFPDLAGPEAK